MKTTKQHPIQSNFSIKLSLLLTLLLIIPFSSSFAEEAPRKNSANHELPTVSYIIPWKSPPMSKIAGKPLKSLTNKDVLQPLDREVFQRQLKYYNLFKNEHIN